MAGTQPFSDNATRALNLIGNNAVMRVARTTTTGDPAVELLALDPTTGAITNWWDFFTNTDMFAIRRRTGGAADVMLRATSTNVDFPLGSATLNGVAIPSISSTNTLTNKTISGASNTLTNIPNSALTNSAITINGTSISLGSSGSITTTAITEGTNLYYTDARARAAQSAGTGISYNSTTGVISTVQDIATTASPSFAGLSTTGTLTVGGDLVVNGTTTTVNSTTITVDDKNIELGSVATPTDITANGGGITLKGSTDKTFNWVSSTASWTSSENLDLASGKTFKINGSDVLTSSQVLGKTLPSGTVVGTTDSQTLTNKTLTSPTINNATVNNLIITGTLTAGGGVGTAGQILQSTGTGVEWTSAAAGSEPADLMYFNILSRVGEVQAKLTSLLQNYLDFDNQTFRTPVGFVDTRTQTINVTG